MPTQNVTFTATEKRYLGNCGCRDCYCPGTLVEDGFSGTNGTTVVGRLPDTVNVQSLWETTGGTWTIQGNKLRQSAVDPGGVHRQAAIECYQSGKATHPITITCDVTVPVGTNSKSPGLCFRYADIDNLWLLTPDVTVGILYLYEATGGVYTVRNSAAISLPAGTYPVSITLNGTSISCDYNGTILTATSAVNQLNTKHGTDDYFDQINNAGTFSEFDNFKVTCT